MLGQLKETRPIISIHSVSIVFRFQLNTFLPGRLRVFVDEVLWIALFRISVRRATVHKSQTNNWRHILSCPNSWEVTDDNLPIYCNMHDYCIIVNSINGFPISADFHLIIIKY